MSNDLVVRGGTIITAADRFGADGGIRAGRIVEIGGCLPRASQEIVAAGLQVLPGGVDVHTHLDVDVGTVHTADDFESGTAAAACGGITTICDYAWQRRGQTIGEAIRTWQAKACDKAHIDYGLQVILSEVSDAHPPEIAAIVAAGRPRRPTARSCTRSSPIPRSTSCTSRAETRWKRCAPRGSAVPACGPRPARSTWR